MKKIIASLRTLLAISSVIALMVCFESSLTTCRALAASATPVPSMTARPATPTEQATFMQFAPHKGWIINQYAVAGPYALVGFTNGYGGWEGLLTNTSGSWVKVVGGGGMTADDFISALPALHL